MSEDFWVRNWSIAEELGEPTPPNLPKPVSELNVPIYCSLVVQRAQDRGFRCMCGCTAMLRAQRSLQKRSQARLAKDELAVMGWVKPRRNSPAWNEAKKIIIDYHTKEDD
jgi:hypothetical protein